MGEPTSREEYERRYNWALRMSGGGLNTITHHPCPFCGEPDWAVVPMFFPGPRVEETCPACHRSGGFVTTRDGQVTVVELVQTAGPRAPEWVPARWAPEEAPLDRGGHVEPGATPVLNTAGDPEPVAGRVDDTTGGTAAAT